MSDTIVCCNPHGKHNQKPYVASKKTKGYFRPITEAMRMSASVLLPLEGHICNSCRLMLKSPSITSAPDMVHDPSVPNVARGSKSILCTNPLSRHANPRRKRVQEKWDRLNGALLKKLQELGNENNIIPNGHVCFDCKYDIHKDHAMKFTPGVYCCDPSKCHDKPNRKTFLTAFKLVTEDHIQMARMLGQRVENGDYICWGCENQLRKEFRVLELQSPEVESMEMDVDDAIMPECCPVESSSDEDSETDSVCTSDEDESSEDECIKGSIAESTFKTLCGLLGVKYERKAELRTKRQCVEKMGEIQGKVRNLMNSFLVNDLDSTKSIPKGCTSCQDLVDRLVECYHSAETMSDKYRCMTSTPTWVSLSKLEKMFSVSRGTAIKVSKLRREKGPLSCPPPRMGKSLSFTTTLLVEAFYRSDENSRFSPSARDTIFLRTNVNGVRRKELVQKREIMSTMRQLYADFQAKNPNIKISISKFASLRPKECTWGFRKGFQKSCLCTKHTNFKLLCEAVNLSGKTGMILENFLCSGAEKCMMGVCEDCPNFQLIDNIVEMYEAPIIEYWSWKSSSSGPTIELKKVSKSKIEFLDHFKSCTVEVSEHHFIYLKQQSYIQSLKQLQNVQDHVGVVNVDFGQNYSFVIPDAVQSFHWNNTQATIHPFCMYYKLQSTSEVKLFTFMVISDTLQHDATSFHVFRSVFIDYIKRKFPAITELVYTSDCAGSQYRNRKNLANLLRHLADFGIKASWCFSAPAHGKDTVDAMSALTKRLVRLESLRRKDNYILTAEDMQQYLHTQNRDDDKAYVFISANFIEAYVQNVSLEERYSQYKTVPGTRKFHYVEVLDTNSLVCKTYAGAAESYVHVFGSQSQVNTGVQGCANPRQLAAGKYGGFVSSGILYMGMISSINEELGEVEVQLMKESKNAYAWTNPVIVRSFSTDDFVMNLSTPCAATSSCRQYRFLESEIKVLTNQAAIITSRRCGF